MYSFRICAGLSVKVGPLMSDSRVPYDDEIDLFEIFETVWDGRWRVIGIVILAVLISIAVNVLKPELYNGSTALSKAPSSSFIKYSSVNETLQQSGFSYAISSQSVFDMFVTEFADYDEVVKILEKSDYIKQRLQAIEIEDRNDFLVYMAKNFEILPPSENGNHWSLDYEWRDSNESKKIFTQSIEDVLANVRQTILSDIDELARTVSIRNKNKKQRLNADLVALEDAINLDLAKRLLYLNEQTAIAKELGVEKNSLNGNGLFQSQNTGVSLSVTSSDIPFYLRGFKAIDKEIDLLFSRSKEDRLAINNTYVSIKTQLSSIHNDVSMQQIMSAKGSVADDDVTSWLAYDLSLATTSSQSKPVLYAILAAMLGLMVGVFNVLVSSAVRKRKSIVSTI